MARRVYTNTPDEMNAYRIASADKPERVVKATDADRLGMVTAAIAATTDEQKAAALAYLHRTGNADVAEVLGLVGGGRAPKHRGREAAPAKTIDLACPYCEAQPGKDCLSAAGERVTYHRDRIRAAKAAAR